MITRNRIFAAFIMGSAVLMTACGASVTAEDKAAQQSAAAEAVTADTRLVAALVYADWCGSCKTLDPKVEAVKADGVEGAAFVTLDYTAKDDTAFYETAKAAGVEAAVRSALGDTVKTGQLLLIDLDDQSVVGVVKKDMSEADITAAIKAAASEA